MRPDVLLINIAGADRSPERRFYMTILAVLIFVNQSDEIWPPAREGRQPMVGQRGEYVVEEGIRFVGRRHCLQYHPAGRCGNAAFD
jgi:hypothetical protein